MIRGVDVEDLFVKADVHAVAPYGPSGASTRVRVVDWLHHLDVSAELTTYAGRADNRPATIACHPIQTVRAQWKLQNLRPNSPRLLLSREASPFGSGALEERLLRHADLGVFDFDDAIYLPLHGMRKMVSRNGKTERAVAAADVVIAGSENLAEWASSINRNVRLIPSCVNPADYAMKTSWEIDSTPRLIWMGSTSTERYLEAVAQPLLRMRELYGAKLILVTGAKTSRFVEPLQEMVVHHQWEPRTAAGHLQRADIALAPLDNNEFARGKCAYKLLQYAASGLPMVGSPVGANAQALERFDGIQASTTAEWSDALTCLLEEGVSRRRTRGESALRSVNENYSFAAWEGDFRSALSLSSG